MEVSVCFPKCTVYIYKVLHISCCVHIFVHFEEYNKANSLHLPISNKIYIYMYIHVYAHEYIEFS